VARVLVVHDTDPDLRIELADDGDDASWDGPCTGCGYTISEGGTRHNGLEDAVHAAIVHLDHHH
jgi:hypothetical protein